MPERISSSERLGLWIWLPVAALALIVLAAVNLPGADCEEAAADAGGFAEVLLIAITVAASLASVAAAGVRLAALARRDDFGLQIGVGIGTAALLLFASTLPLWGDNGPMVTRLFYFGAMATAAAFVLLLVAWLISRKTEDVGILLPLYLIGAGVFVYPSFTLLALAINSGGLC